MNSYKEYKQYNENSPFTEEQYNEYFNTGDKIEKLLVGETARVLRQFLELNTVSVILNFNGKEYNVDAEREKLNNFLGFKIEDTSPDDDKWQEMFSNVYVSGIKNEKKNCYLINLGSNRYGLDNRIGV